ncbi:MAG: hypothetical protein ACD_28C00404G0003, partial [uncultured bacterium]
MKNKEEIIIDCVPTETGELVSETVGRRTLSPEEENAVFRKVDAFLAVMERQESPSDSGVIYPGTKPNRSLQQLGQSYGAFSVNYTKPPLKSQIF